MSEEALQIAERRREAKGKRERERHNQLNVEFHRIVKRDKRIFLNEQCVEIEQKIEWERLGISSRKSELSREYFMQGWENKGQKWYGPNRSRTDKEEVAIIYRRTTQQRF